jgi:hypothetical protein
MAILMREGKGRVIFKHGKYMSREIDDVAKEDPGYLKWVFNSASEDLSNDLFDALETCLSDNDIEI